MADITRDQVVDFLSNMPVIQLAERAIVLDFGKVLAEGAPAVVMRDPEVVEAYLGRARIA